MIVKMKRYTFLVFYKQYADFLEKLREIGVLHVIEKEEGIAENDNLREKMQLASRIQQILQQLEKYLDLDSTESKQITIASDDEQGLKLLAQVEALNAEIEQVQMKLQLSERELDRMMVWGNFDLRKLNELSNNGIIVDLFSCQLSKYDPAWDEEFQTFEIASIGGTKYFAVIHNSDETILIDAEPVSLNEKNVSQLETEVETLNKEIESKQNILQTIAHDDIATLYKLMANINGNIDLTKVELSTSHEADSKVMLLEGYTTESVESKLNEFLDTEGIYYEVSNPSIDENIPVQLKNSAYSKLFEPITELFSLPNYGELDPTPFLAPFFMLFFGLCMGDGGYGLLIWAVSTFMKRKAKPDMKPLLSLGQYLGGATVIVGLLTGSVFGIALDLVEWGWLAGVKDYFITPGNFAQNFGGYNPMMIIAVIIGVIQILFGMIINVLKINKQHGFKYAAGHFAWFMFIVSMIVYLGLPLLNVVLPIAALYSIYAIAGLSALIILFYNSPGKNIFSNLGSALWNTYNMATGLLGDTLSYIRLFALGLTGSILGGVFNTLAFDLTADVNPFARWIFVLLILLIGHSINFALCLIGAFVHPLRLTFVEFYKNAGFEGGGKAYKPFKNVQKQDL